MNFPDFIRRIEEKAGVQTANLPIIKAAVWFPQRDAHEVNLMLALCPPEEREREQKAFIDSLLPTVFRLGHPCPIALDLTVVSIFRDAEEMRVYCIPLVPAGQTAPTREVPPRLYTLSLRSSVYTITEMNIDVMIIEVGYEWAGVWRDHTNADALEFGDEDDDEELEEGDEEQPDVNGELPGAAGAALLPSAPESPASPSTPPVAPIVPAA